MHICVKCVFPMHDADIASCFNLLSDFHHIYYTGYIWRSHTKDNQIHTLLEHFPNNSIQPWAGLELAITLVTLVSDLYDQRIYMYAWNHYLCTMVYILAYYLDIKSVFKSLPCSTGKSVQTALNITYVCITEVFTCGDLKYPEYVMSVLYKTPNILKIPLWHPDIICFFK